MTAEAPPLTGAGPGVHAPAVSHDDRRKHPRVRVPLLVQYLFSPLGELRTDYASDLSEGGIFINNPEPVLPGTPIQLQFLTREGLELVNAEGRVVRTANGGQGVQFVRLLPDDLRRLTELITRVQERQRAGEPT